MKPSPLQLARPRSLEEALELLAEHGDDAKVHRRRPEPRATAELPARRARGAGRPQPASPASPASSRRGTLASARSDRSATSSATRRPSPPVRCSRSRRPASGTSRSQPRHRRRLARARGRRRRSCRAVRVLGDVEVTRPAGRGVMRRGGFFVFLLTTLPRADEILTEVRFPVPGRLGLGLRRGAPRAWRLRRGAVACRCASTDGSSPGGARRRRGSDRPAALHAAEGALVGSRPTPRRRGGGREARGERRSQRPRTARRVPRHLDRRARRRAARSAPTRWGGDE